MRKILLLLLMVVNFTMVGASDDQITAAGRGPTEREALMAAQRKAVEQGVGVLVDSRSYTENLKLIEDKIYSKASGYVKHYTVISPEKQDDGSWKVTIKCAVAEEEIKVSLKALKILRDMMENPRIVIEPGPPNNNGIPQEYHALVVSEAYEGIVEYLREREFPVVSKENAELGTRDNAEYTLVYNIKPGDGLATDIFKKAWVMISAKIINRFTGQVLVTQSKKVMGVDKDFIDFAFRKAGRKAGKLTAKFLEKKLIEIWKGETISGRVVILEVINIDNFKQLLDFEAKLKKTYGVRNIFQRNSISNTTEYEITYVGGTGTLKENAYKILEKMGLKAKVPISYGDWICIELIH